MLGDTACFVEDIQLQHRHWRAFDDAPTSRHVLYRTIWELLQPLSEDERRSVLNDILLWASSEVGCRSTHRTLTTEEVLALGAGDLVAIGAHTVTHPVLASLPQPLQRNEMQS